ncbi:hypothetical protein ACFW04_009346 [Cataglyphis niger]
MSNSTIRYSLADVGKCDGKNGARTWIVIYDNIYDVTDYITQHPGGTELIEEYAGKDATNGFDDFGHSSDAKKILKEYLIGELEERFCNKTKCVQTYLTIYKKKYLYINIYIKSLRRKNICIRI